MTEEDTDDDKNDEVLSLFLTCLNVKESKHDIWFLDSGCSNHMTGLRNIFLSLDESIKMHVRLGDDKQVQVESKGTVGVRTKSGKVKHIDNVFYIPGLAHNLISIGQLIQRGYSVMFHDDVCEIRNIKSEYVGLKVKMTENRMFPLEFSSLEESALVVKGENESFLAFAIWSFAF